jgi:hypothetical protein
MTLLTPNVGEALMLAHMVGKTAIEDLVLKLYKNDVTPAEADTAASYTEADFTGYAAATLTGASWVITPGAPSSAAYAEQAFASSADQSTQSIYGYFVVGASSGTLAWAERFSDGPYAITLNGDEIDVTPQYTLD